MSTELDIFSSGTALAQTSKRDDGFTNKVAGSTITNKTIGIINNKFRLMVNGKEISRTDQPHLDVVIVNSCEHVHRMYYKDQYDPKALKKAPPLCWTDNSITPHPKAAHKQSDNCQTCPQNIKGSGPGNTKACRYSRNVAVVLANDIAGDVYKVKLSATSIFGSGNTERHPFHEYKDYLVANNEGLMTVVSRMLVGEDTSNIGFRPVGRLDDAQFEICKQKSQSEEALRAISLTVATDKTDEDGVEFEQPTPKAEPVVAKVEDDIAEPVKRNAEPEPTPAPKPATPKIDQGDVSLDDLVSDWT